MDEYEELTILDTSCRPVAVRVKGLASLCVLIAKDMTITVKNTSEIEVQFMESCVMPSYEDVVYQLVAFEMGRRQSAKSEYQDVVGGGLNLNETSDN